MNENAGELGANSKILPTSADDSAQIRKVVPREATYSVQFSKFWPSASRAENAFDLARRGEIELQGDRVLVRAFRREMLFMGTRIELAFELSQIADVERTGNCLSFSIAAPDRDTRSIKLWTEDEAAARRLASEFPTTMSAHAIAMQDYEAHLASAGPTLLATYALIAANVLLFAATAIGGAGFSTANPDVLQVWGTNYGPLTTNGEWWRLISSMFLHFGILHLTLNMWALFIGGRQTERIFGSPAFVLIYFTAGIAGSLSSLVWNPAVHSAGASGAIFGVYGAMLAFFLRKDSSIPQAVIRQQRASGLVFIGFNLMNGLSSAGIDNAAHIGGLAAGLVMGLVMARPVEPEARVRVNDALFYARGSVLAAAILGGLFLRVYASRGSNAEEQAFRRDLVVMGKLEKNAQIAFTDALGRLRSGTYTPTEFAQRLERDVLPRWTTIQENFQRDRVPDKSKLKPLWELIADYSDTRLEAFKLFDSGARTGRSGDYKKAQNELELGQMDLKLIKDLDKGK